VTVPEAAGGVAVPGEERQVHHRRMSSTRIRLRTEVRGTLNSPRVETPRRTPGAVRRTTVIDTTHPGGPGGELLLLSQGRDARTRADGSLELLDTVELRARLAPDRTLLAVEGGPAALQQLVGRRVAAGFRAALGEVLPEQARAGTVVHQVVDDWVGAALVAGLAELDAAGPVATDEQIAQQRANADYSRDLCAGWASDATLIATIDELGVMPVNLGPPTPELRRADDPQGWPDTGELRAGDSRRTRRLDVSPENGDYLLDVHFRDSWVGSDEQSRVVHEYSLQGHFDPQTEVITSVVPSAHVLPWPECPAAVASATRVVGLSLEALRQTVRKDFTGITTCTHLNDVVRSLADLPLLARQVG
jgi:hypothetical protein